MQSLSFDIESLERRLNLTSHVFDEGSPFALESGDSTTTFRLRGVGQATVHVDDATGAFELEVQGTNDRSALFVFTKGDDTTLNGVDATALRLLKTRNVTVSNANLNFHEGIDRILIGDISNSQVNVAGTDLLDNTTIIVGIATDLNVNSEQIIRFARADSLIDGDGTEDVWEAAAINRLRVKGEMQSELVSTSWIASLPTAARRGIAWSADHEEGSLFDWHQGGGENAGGGIFNTGDDEVEAVVSTVVAHSGRYSARATITGAYQQQNGDRAVRLMRWTDRPWDDGGDIFRSPSYFSTWMYIPEDYDPDSYDPENGGWWNVFQFKSDDAVGVSQPMFAMNIGVNESGQMVPYLWSSQLETSFAATPETAIPSGQWVHFEAYYKSAANDRGRITLYQNGQKIIDVNRIQTVMPGGDESVVWGIGNYTNHIEGGAVHGQATIYFDDAVVGTKRVGRYF